MATHLSERAIYDLIIALRNNDWNVSETARELGMKRPTLQHRREMLIREQFIDKENNLLDAGKFIIKNHQEKEVEDEHVVFPEIPSDEIEIDELWDHLERRYEKRLERHLAAEWMEFKMKAEGPFALAFVGDPHVDDGGTDVKLLRRDIKLMEEVPYLWGVGLGDWTNNWIGRLSRIYASQEVSKPQAWQLAADIISRKKTGTNKSIWWLLIKGNHDLWSGTDDPLDWMERGGAVLEKWEAKFAIKCPNGKEFRVWAAHDFPGNSIYNPNHGGMRKALFSGISADLYISGHRHNWALFNNEDYETGKPYWVARARGYKFIDEYAKRLGFGSQIYGATITAVIDPSSNYSMHCYADMEEAVDFLNYKRKKYK